MKRAVFISLILSSLIAHGVQADINGIKNIAPTDYFLVSGDVSECESKIKPRVRISEEGQKVLELTGRLNFLWLQYPWDSSLSIYSTCPESGMQSIDEKVNETTFIFELHADSCRKDIPNASLRDVLVLTKGKEIKLESRRLKRDGKKFIIDPSGPAMLCVWQAKPMPR